MSTEHDIICERGTEMLQIRDAVQKSQQYLVDIFPDASTAELQLESAELSDDAKFWYITFSYRSKSPGLGFSLVRDYKTIKVRAQDGKLYGARNGLSSQGLM
jgi:hypothetical protein